MAKIILLLILLTATSFCYKNPEILSQIALYSSKSKDLEGVKTSCYNSVKYILKTITLSSNDEIDKKLGQMVEDLKTINEFESDINSKIKSNLSPIIYVIYLSQNTHNHYFIIEYFKDDVFIFQSFENVYGLYSYPDGKKMKLYEFLQEMQKIISHPEKTQSIRRLFCFDSNISFDFGEFFTKNKKKCNWILAYFFFQDITLTNLDLYYQDLLSKRIEKNVEYERAMKKIFEDPSKLNFSFSFFEVNELNLKDLKSCIPKKGYLNCSIF